MTTLPKPIYQSARCILYCGDCREIMPLLKGVDAVVADPPYGIGFEYGLSEKETHGFKNCHKTHTNAKIKGDDVDFDPAPVLAFGGDKPIALCGGDCYAQRLPRGVFLTWDKACGQGAANSFADSEIIWTNRRNPRRIFHHFWSGGCRSGEGAPSRERRLHVSQKPVELMAWIMATIRIGIGKTVCDPYMGSASTGVACLNTGRRFIGIEIDPDHAATAAERIARKEADLFP